MELTGQPRVPPIGAEQIADVARGEAVHDHPAEQSIATEVDGQLVERRGRRIGRRPGRPEHHHPARLLVAQYVLDHLQRRGVGPVEIIEDDEERIAGGLRAQDLGHALEEQVALDAGLGGGGPDLGDELFELGEQEGEVAPLAGDPTPGLGRDRPERRPDRLDHRLERHDRLGGGPAPEHDGTLLVDLGREAGGQAGLARPGLADHQREVAVAGQDAVPDPVEGGELGRPPDEVGGSAAQRGARQRDG